MGENTEVVKDCYRELIADVLNKIDSLDALIYVYYFVKRKFGIE